MTRYLSLAEVLILHARILERTGGSAGVRDTGAIEAALTQPRSTFDGKELYPGPVEKAAARCYSLSLNHPFVDGNKRIAHAAMETFLMLNGYELVCPVDDGERIMLDLAGGACDRDRLIAWIQDHVVPFEV